MTKEEAVNYLIAYACCGLPVLQCDLDCPTGYTDNIYGNIHDNPELLEDKG